MKKSQNDRTILGFVMMLAIFVASIMMILDMAQYDTGWLWRIDDDSKLSIDWHYAGVFFTCLIIAVAAWVVRTVKYTAPMFKHKSALPITIAECLIPFGLLMALIGLFLPIGLQMSTIPGGGDEWEIPRMAAACTMLMVGLPISFFSSIASGILNYYR
ncbi:MAG: hypothetical protein ACOQNY_00510 [Mycoplasmoidaceae bacterium]